MTDTENKCPACAKAVSFDRIAGLCAQLRLEGKQIVQCHGNFDVLHPGHIMHLEEAKTLGDVLVVTLYADSQVKKGPTGPIFQEDLRAKILGAIEAVDHVVLIPDSNAVEAIHRIRPHFYCKGKEYESDRRETIEDELAAVQEIGGEVRFVGHVQFEPDEIINTYTSIYPPEVQRWLDRFKAEFSTSDVLDYIRKTKNLRTLVIGEAIIDEYVFCSGLGKSNKDPILAFKYGHMETYAGGSLAVANHVAGFCDNVGLLCYLGETERNEEYIRDSLKKNVRAHYVTRRAAPTLRKRRFVDNHTFAKVFEVYYMDDTPRSNAEEKELAHAFNAIIDDYDLVIVIDFGHGMMSKPIRDQICASDKFIAVNTQANAGNRGFNTISKYTRADYVCLAGHEVELETRLKYAPFGDLIHEVEKSIDCKRFTITLGRDGTLHNTSGQPFINVPAFATKVTDRVGAGDAVLSLSSLLAYLDAPWEIIGLAGNLAGAIMVSELGNRISLDRSELMEQITAVLG